MFYWEVKKVLGSSINHVMLFREFFFSETFFNTNKYLAGQLLTQCFVEDQCLCHQAIQRHHFLLRHLWLILIANHNQMYIMTGNSAKTVIQG